MSDRLATAREVASKLGVSTGALLRWTRAGRVPGAVKLPSGAVRYRLDKLDVWLDECGMAGDAPRGVSTAPDATRREDGNLSGSTAPLRGVAATTEEEPDAR